MSVLRLEERVIGSRTWYRLMRDDGLIAMGGLRSSDEAEAWAMEAGHTVANGPKKSGGVAPQAVGPVTTTAEASAGPVALDGSPAGRALPGTIWETHGTGKWHSLPRPTSRPPHGASAPGRKPPAAGRAREAISVPSVRVGPASPTKEEASCCLARALPDGRPVIGFCSDECVRRPARAS